MRFCELKQKEVINIRDCKKLGFVGDLIFEPSNGCIKDLIVPGPGRICGIIGRDQEYIIHWKQIRQIGPDIILVDICEEEAMVKC